MFNSKKGIGIDDAVPMIIFILVAVFAIFLFRINEEIKNQDKIDEIKYQGKILDGHEVLINYLIQVDDNDNTRSYFLSTSYTEGNYDILKEDMREYFESKLSPYTLKWRLELVDPSGKEIFSMEKLGTGVVFRMDQVASVSIPIDDDEYSYVTLKLYFGKIEVGRYKLVGT